MAKPAQFSNLDTALLTAATVAWIMAIVNYDAGIMPTAGAQAGLAYLFTAVYLTREVRRWRWELR